MSRPDDHRKKWDKSEYQKKAIERKLKSDDNEKKKGI